MNRGRRQTARTRARISLLISAALLAASVLADAEPATSDVPQVSWEPRELSFTVARGEAATQRVAFTSSQKLKDVALVVVPKLAPFVTVSPSAFANVSAVRPVSVSVTAAVPETGALGTLDGVIQLRAQGKNLANPLPLILTIGEAIGSPGGVVESPDGGVVLTIPADALTEPVTITVETADSGPPETFGTAVTPVYDFGPDGTTFASPATLTFVFDALALPEGTDPSTLVVAFDEGGDNWLGLPTTVDLGNSTATAAIFHFTRFGLVRPAPGPTVLYSQDFESVPLGGTPSTWTEAFGQMTADYTFGVESDVGVLGNTGLRSLRTAKVDTAGPFFGTAGKCFNVPFASPVPTSGTIAVSAAFFYTNPSGPPTSGQNAFSWRLGNLSELSFYFVNDNSFTISVGNDGDPDREQLVIGNSSDFDNRWNTLSLTYELGSSTADVTVNGAIRRTFPLAAPYTGGASSLVCAGLNFGPFQTGAIYLDDMFLGV